MKSHQPLRLLNNTGGFPNIGRLLNNTGEDIIIEEPPLYYPKPTNNTRVLGKGAVVGLLSPGLVPRLAHAHDGHLVYPGEGVHGGGHHVAYLAAAPARRRAPLH